jgi:hypothetical protein
VMLCGCAGLRSSRPKRHHCPGLQAGAPAAGPQRACEHTRSCCATGMRPRTACMALRTTDDPLDERARGKRQAAKEFCHVALVSHPPLLKRSRQAPWGAPRPRPRRTALLPPRRASR